MDPGGAAAPGPAERGGRPPRDSRQVVAGLLWLTRTGAAWRELPPAYGAWLSVYRYYHRWTASGH